ncbi:MAG: asparagine synthase, partial [Nitrosomonadaceae bacterium]
MSGLCGWIGHGSIITENRQLAERMARPLVRFDDSNVQILVGRNSALAVAANGESAHFYQNKELMVALWGRPQFLDSRLAQLARTDGVAKTLANSWLDNGEKAFAGLVGTFVL